MDKIINNSWDKLLENEFNKDYFKLLENKIDLLYKEKTIYPKKEDIFRAFINTSYDEVKVVILGQDPYHEERQAMGLSFSVHDNVKIPKSLINIFKELKNDLNIESPSIGDLTKWSKEGVFLLNTILTVEEKKPLSHINMGWERFTDSVIKLLNDTNTPIVFILWGNNARSKRKLITNPSHLIIESAHPSPLSSYHGFFGSKPFSKTNEFLKRNNIKEIDWSL